MLPAFLLNGLYALGFRLLNEHIASDDDTSEVEDAIVNAKSPDEVKAVVKKELLQTFDDQILTDTDIPESVEVLNTAQGQKTFIDTMGTLLKSIVNLIFKK